MHGNRLSPAHAEPRGELLIAKGFEAVLQAHGLDSLERLFADDLGERLDKPGLASWRQRRRIVLEIDGKQRTFYLKRFKNPPGTARRQVSRAGCGAKTAAGVEWAWMHRLRDDGIACSRPVALGEQMRGRRELRSVLVTEAVAGESLERWMARWDELDQAKAKEVLQSLARLVSRFHQKGYIHRDLYLSHVFFDSTAPVEESLCLIDLQRVLRPGWRKTRWIVKDLASLNFSAPQHCTSRAERLRWLREYLGTGKLSAADKRLAYRVIGKSMSIARRERSRE